MSKRHQLMIPYKAPKKASKWTMRYNFPATSLELLFHVSGFRIIVHKTHTYH